MELGNNLPKAPLKMPFDPLAEAENQLAHQLTSGENIQARDLLLLSIAKSLATMAYLERD
jgi:hypothetical protein